MWVAHTPHAHNCCGDEPMYDTYVANAPAIEYSCGCVSPDMTPVQPRLRQLRLRLQSKRRGVAPWALTNKHTSMGATNNTNTKTKYGSQRVAPQRVAPVSRSRPSLLLLLIVIILVLVVVIVLVLLY